MFISLKMSEKGRATPAKIKLAVNQQKTIRFLFPFDMYDQVQFKTQISVFKLNGATKRPETCQCPIDKGIIYKSDYEMVI